MAPTIKKGEQVTVDHTAYKFADPMRWDVIVFLAPSSSNVHWAMRVVALPGETVTSSTNGIEVNGKLIVPPSHVSNVTYQSVIQLGHAHGVPSPFVVPMDSYWVLGDNSTNSNDSRYWGAVARTNVKWKVLNK